MTESGEDSVEACIILGVAYQQGDRVDEDGKPIAGNYKLALDYYTAACDAGNPHGCTFAAGLYEDGLVKAKGKEPNALALAWG